jgi:hypothetical protein
MSWENEESSWDNGSSRHGSSTMSAEDMKRQIQKNKDFIGNIHLQTDEKTGDSYVLGMRVPKNLRPVIELGIENAKPYIIDQSENIYKNSSKLAKKMGFTNAHNRIGVVAENTFRWGIIGAQPIYGIVHASQTYAKERKELFKEFSPVISTSKTDYKKNEVIKSAFERVHDDWLSNLRMVASDIPTLIPMVILGRQDQVASAAKRKRIQEDDTLKNEIAKKHADPYEQQRILREKINDEVSAEVEARMKKWVEANSAEGKRFAGKPEQAEDYYYQNLYRSEHERISESRSNPKSDEAKEADKEKSDKMLKFLVPFASAISQIFKANVEESAAKRKKSVNAWKLIRHMKEEIDAQFSNARDGESGQRSADDIRISMQEGKDGGGRDLGLKQYIIEVFKQNELDNGRAGLGNNLIAQLEPAVNMIAEHIADGSLDSSALLKLVGENKVIIHNGSARKFAPTEQVEKAVNELLATMGTKEDVKLEEFFADFADPILIKKAIKDNLCALKGADRAFFASLFPDPILEQAGMKKKEIIDIRKEIHDRKYAIVAASVAYLSKKDPEELKKWGLPEKDIEAVTQMASKLEAKDIKALQAAVDGRDKTIIAAIRTVGLNQQVSKTGDGDAYWTNRVKESDGIRGELVDARKHQKEERKQDDSNRHRKMARKPDSDENFASRVDRNNETDDPSDSLSR